MPVCIQVVTKFIGLHTINATGAPIGSNLPKGSLYISDVNISSSMLLKKNSFPGIVHIGCTAKLSSSCNLLSDSVLPSCKQFSNVFQMSMLYHKLYVSFAILTFSPSLSCGIMTSADFSIFHNSSPKNVSSPAFADAFDRLYSDLPG